MVAADISKELFQEEEAHVKRGIGDLISYECCEVFPRTTLVTGKSSWGQKFSFTIHLPAASSVPSRYTANACFEESFDKHRKIASSL